MPLLAGAAALLLGNGAIAAATLLLRCTRPAPVPGVGIRHAHPVDPKVIRGAAPGRVGLRDLAAAGVTTVVDLRAEAGIAVHDDLLAELGIERHALPVRDGQVPTEDQARRLLRIVDEAPGAVYLHCGAGVGRTGAMAAWYLHATGQATGTEALRRNLAIGPPSLEQVAFALRTAGGEYARPGPAVTALSRVLDGPRRLWHHLT